MALSMEILFDDRVAIKTLQERVISAEKLQTKLEPELQ